MGGYPCGRRRWPPLRAPRYSWPWSWAVAPTIKPRMAAASLPCGQALTEAGRLLAGPWLQPLAPFQVAWPWPTAPAEGLAMSDSPLFSLPSLQKHSNNA
ncbi:hypothetical protein GW17_00048823 [Ensete ventricosum]|nr:hypothetical protein GW17_00048823 [Ensete ventricosum]